MTPFLRRLLWLVRRPRLEREMDEEFRAHLELEAADRIASGVDPGEARRLAARDFGRIAAAKEDARDARGAPLLEQLARDVRHAGRALRRAPAAPAVAIITLALGLAAVTTVVTVLQDLVLTPLPYPESDRMVVLWERSARNRFNVVSGPNFEAWRDRLGSVTDVAGLVPDFEDLQAGRPERVAGATVTPSWFGAVGVAPALGRAFTEEEARAHARVMVLSDGLWRERFGADPRIVGRTAPFGDRTYQIVGVMPPRFEPPSFGWLGATQRYWIPFTVDDDNRQWGRFLLVLGRLRPGVDVRQADAELAALALARQREDPGANEGWSAGVRLLAEQVTGDLRPILLAMSVAVGALLLAAGANLATLMLARARRRRSELAVRVALGAGRGRLVRALAIEGALLGVVAAPVGLVLGDLTVRALAVARLDLMPRAERLGVDGPIAGLVAGLALLLTTLAGLVAGAAIPRGATRPSLASRDGGIGLQATRTLIVTEVAVAVLLTVVAGLGARSFLALRNTRLGFDPTNVAAVRISLPAGRYPGPVARAFFDDVVARISALPGVSQVGLADWRPYSSAGSSTQVGRAGEAIDRRSAPAVDVRSVSAGYFEALRIPRLRGAPFDGSAPAGVAISRALADQLWPGQDPLGARLALGFSPDDTVTVRAVVDDVRLGGPKRPLRGVIYLPLEHRFHTDLDILIRADRPVESLVPLLRSEVGAVDPTIAVYDVAGLGSVVDRALATDRVSSWLLSGFSVVSLLLAAGGIAAVLLVELARRRRELGVRMALGASPGAIRTTIIRSGAVLLLPGLAIGMAAAGFVAPLIRASVPGVGPGDPVAFAVGGLLLVLVVAAALVAPVRRAAAVDPIEVLRGD